MLIQVNKWSTKELKIHASIDLAIFLTVIDIGPWNSLMMHVPKLPNVHVFLHRGLFFLTEWAENSIIIIYTTVHWKPPYTGTNPLDK